MAVLPDQSYVVNVGSIFGLNNSGTNLSTFFASGGLNVGVQADGKLLTLRSAGGNDGGAA